MRSNQIRLLLMSLLAVFAISAVASASSASAAGCFQVAEVGKGLFKDPGCTVAGPPNEYIKISKLETWLKAGEWCAKVETAKTGDYEENKCAVGKKEGEYIKVVVFCLKVAVAGTGNKDSSCNTNAGATANEYINIEKLETQLKLGEWCAKVAFAGTGVYEDNKCEKAGGSKEYIKVKALAWQVCEEKAGAGTEPPIKYDEHKCNTQTKALALRKWEWKFLEAGKSYNITSKGGTQKLIGHIGGVAIEIECKKVEDTGNIKGGVPGTDEGSITYTECKIVGAAGCGVKSPPPTKAGTILVASVKTTLDTIGEEFSTASGTFVELELGETENTTTHEFEKKCGVFPLAKQKITGVVVGKAEGTNPCETLNFTKPPQEGSTLKFGTEAAEYIGEVTFELENKWAFRCS